MTHHNPFRIIIPLLLISPFIALIFTWNALPTSNFFFIKKAFEATAKLVVSPSHELSSNLAIAITSRRVDEANRLLALGSIAGLPPTLAQAETTSELILSKKPDPTHPLSLSYAATLEGAVNAFSATATQLKLDSQGLQTSTQGGSTSGDSPSPFSLGNASRTTSNESDINDLNFILDEIKSAQSVLTSLLAKHLPRPIEPAN